MTDKQKEFPSVALVAFEGVQTVWAEATHPTQGRFMVPCEMDVAHLRRGTARLSFIHGGEPVRDFETFGDGHHNEFLDCINDAVERAILLSENYGVTAESSASVEVWVSIEDEPVLVPEADASRPSEPGPRWWLPVPVNKFMVQVDDGSGSPTYKRFGSAPVADVLIWSTKPQADGKAWPSAQEIRSRLLPLYLPQTSIEADDFRQLKAPKN